jgi:hypothetical protein
MSSINLGPYNVNKPTTDEKANIRQSLGLYSASLLDATFDSNGNVLTISDPNNSSNVITFDKNRLNATVAASLETARVFSVSGDVTTTTAQQFNGTGNVNIPVSINANAITASKIADGSIIATKIPDSSIAHGKLTPGAPVWTTTTFATTTNSATIGNNTSGVVTLSLGGTRSGAGDATLNFKAATGDTVHANITRASGSDGNFAIENTGSGQLLIKQTNNVPIIFYTNNLERMRIISSGSIGIGKNNPATLLDVNGVITATRYDGKISSSALVSGSALELSGDGLLQIKDLGVTTAKLADSSVTTAKLENSSSPTTGVTTAKLADGSVTNAKLASNVVGNGPAFRAILTSSQSITGGAADIKITLTKNFDTHNNFDNATSCFTATIAGYYLFTGCTWTNGGSHASHSVIYKNNARAANGSHTGYSAGSDVISSVCCMLYLAVGDKIELWCYRNATGSIIATNANSSSGTYLTGCLIRSA